MFGDARKRADCLHFVCGGGGGGDGVCVCVCVPGIGRASQGTAISGSCQKNLVGICNSVWVW